MYARWRPSSPQLSYLGERCDAADALGCALCDLERFGTLARARPRPQAHPRGADSFGVALRHATVRRFDCKPASYCVDLRQLARSQAASVRGVLERLQQEYPEGWLCADDAPIDPAQPLPLHVALHYWIPVLRGPTHLFLDHCDDA
jgi:hypothetical protein